MHKFTSLLTIGALILFSTGCAPGSAGTRFLDRTAEIDVPLSGGWFVVNGGGAPRPAPTVQSDGKAALEFRPQHEGDGGLVAPGMPLNGFASLSFKVWSQHQVLLAVVIEDRHNAKFHAGIPIPADRWTDVRITPADFQVNDDSPVKSGALDATQANPTFLLVEAKLPGGNQPNVIRVAEIKVGHHESQASMLNVPELIEGREIVITSGGQVPHHLSIRKGGKLIFKNVDVHLTGDVALDGGTLAVDGGTLTIENKYPHQFAVNAVNGSAFVLSGCQYYSPFMTFLNAAKSNVQIKNCQFHGTGFTCPAETSTVTVENSTGVGEFVIRPDSHYTFSGCSELLLWMQLGPGQKVDLSFPSPQEQIGKFKMPPESKLDLTLRDCRRTLFCLLAVHDCEVTVRDCFVRACGLIFLSSSSNTVNDLQNDVLHKNYTVPLSDRKLTFINSRVQAWCAYPFERARLEITGSKFGEMNANMNADVVINKSTCDGSGGYIRVSDQSTATVADSQLTCSVVATDRAKLNLERCTIDGAVSASGQSTVILKNCRLNGQRQEIGGGRITVVP